jgi:hypothetical protein
MKKWIRTGALVLLAVASAAALTFASGENTLVSLSYLNGTYTTQLTQALSAKTSALDDAYQTAMSQTGTQSGSWTSSATFETLSLSTGDTVTLSVGSGLMWYSGTGSASALLVDVTTGKELAAGGALTAGHRYLADRETVVTAKAASSCGVQGQWNTTASRLVFTDVTPQEFWYDPVLWAVENNVTNGTTTTTFSPTDSCERAQVVTFLWRAEGCPEPTTTVNPFVDVKSDAYYYKAVLWAVENGITNGTGSNTFSPYDVCDRAQAVTFLWRAKGSPEPATATNPFTDVKTGQFYTKAVLWAVENGVTNGTGNNSFSPSETCSRGQIVTFLYRTYNQ